MASELLAALVRLTLVGSIAVMGVMLLRLAVRRWLGALAAYGLWLAVPVAAGAAFLPARVAEPGLVFIPLLAGPERTMAVRGGPDVAWAAVGLWALGVAASVAWVLWRHARAMHGARRPALGPAVVGVMRPRIVLPADFETRFSAAEREVILAHERRHVAAGHLPAMALAVLAVCANWFNPLAHLALAMFRIDQELACDAAVIGLHPGRRKTYAEAMLKTSGGGLATALGCAWPGRRMHPLTERIALIGRAQPGPWRRRVGAAVLTTAIVASGVGAWAAQPSRAAPEPASPEPTRGFVPVSRPAPRDGLAPVPKPPEPTEGFAPVPKPAPTVELPADGSDFEVSYRERPQPAPPGLEEPASDETSVPVPLPPRAERTGEPDRRARWVERPTAARPGAASGLARVTCKITGEGRLTGCRVVSAAANGPGDMSDRILAQEALRLADQFRIAPRTPDGRSLEGTEITVPIRIQIPG